MVQKISNYLTFLLTKTKSNISIILSLLISNFSLIAAKYNKKLTSDDWNEKLDINNDNIIDMFDLVLVSKKVK